MHDGPGKSLIDLSRVSEEDFRDGGNPHKPLKAACTSSIWLDHNRLPICIYHYLGKSQPMNVIAIVGLEGTSFSSHGLFF